MLTGRYRVRTQLILFTSFQFIQIQDLEDQDCLTYGQMKQKPAVTVQLFSCSSTHYYIPSNEYLTPVRNKRKIKAKVYDNCVTKNFVSEHQNLNDNCFTTISSNSTIYRNSFFPKMIVDWNQLGDISLPSHTRDI